MAVLQSEGRRKNATLAAQRGNAGRLLRVSGLSQMRRSPWLDGGHKGCGAGSMPCHAMPGRGASGGAGAGAAGVISDKAGLDCLLLDGACVFISISFT